MIYLMQHGEAEAVDPRPLSQEGRANVERVAQRAAAAGVRVATVFHSEKLRARETAVILAEALQARLEERADLGPNDEPAPLARLLKEGRAEPVAVVGHLPHLDRLLALLGPTGVAFRNAALLHIDDGRLHWALWPELA